MTTKTNAAITFEADTCRQTFGQHTFAAVAYLNMLPFFAEDSAIQLFETPASLNAAPPHCSAYCSSLIAGLTAQQTPLSTELGVFSSGPVHSVFIEPILRSEKHVVFWKQLEELWAHQHPDPAAGLRSSDLHGTIVLRSSGASEQSLWMLKVLFALAGFRTEVASQSLDNAETLGQHPADDGKNSPEACLWIGDPALARSLVAPDAYRIDVGQIWNSHTGHKAWFAGWFQGSACGNSGVSECTIELSNRIRAWTQRSDFSRWCSIFKFLSQRRSQLLERNFKNPAAAEFLNHDEQHWEIRDALADYFAALEFSVSADEGQRLLAFYSQLGAALNDWQSKAAAHTVLHSTIQLPHEGLPAAHAHRNICQTNAP